MFPLFDHLLFNNLASYSLKLFNHLLHPSHCKCHEITYSCRIMFFPLLIQVVFILEWKFMDGKYYSIVLRQAGDGITHCTVLIFIQVF